MKKFLLFIFVLLIAVVALAYVPIGQSANNRTLKPGDEIDGMIVTTGVVEAPPLWAFCSPVLEDEGVLHVDCHVPSVSKLAIGHPFEGTDQALQSLDWSEKTWQLSLDGYPLDLEAFGVYTYVVPDLAPSPSPIREVFRQNKAWDVVLVNPTVGAHTLRGMAHTEVDTYLWTMNFMVEER